MRKEELHQSTRGNWPYGIQSHRVFRKRWYEHHWQYLKYLNQRKVFLCLKHLLCSTEVPLGIYQDYVSQIHGYWWWIYREDTIYREASLNMSIRSYCSDLWRLDVKFLSKQKRNKSAMSGAQFMSIEIPIICC